MPDFRLRKEERIKSKKQLDTLFAKGHSIRAVPLRLVWVFTARDNQVPVLVSFAVPRKSWKRAVDRNLIRRRMREAYRTHKHILYDMTIPTDKQILLSCMYTADTIYSFDQIRKAMDKVLHNLQRIILKEIA
jgi:ribonuclease P protein component